jgi:hypothetical protein
MGAYIRKCPKIGPFERVRIMGLSKVYENWCFRKCPKIGAFESVRKTGISEVSENWGFRKCPKMGLSKVSIFSVRDRNFFVTFFFLFFIIFLWGGGGVNRMVSWYSVEQNTLPFQKCFLNSETCVTTQSPFLFDIHSLSC